MTIEGLELDYLRMVRDRQMACTDPRHGGCVDPARYLPDFLLARHEWACVTYQYKVSYRHSHAP